MLRLYNTLSRKKEAFKPLHGKKVGIYTCGPTVYDFIHIGNLKSFLAEDVLKRYLLYNGFKVKHVRNITDVDDKTIRGSKKEGIPFFIVCGFRASCNLWAASKKFYRPMPNSTMQF